MKFLLLAILVLSIIIPIGMTDAFGETTATVTLEKSFTVDADPREATPRGLTFNDDGTKMYFVGGTRDKIYEYHLSTPFEIDTAVNYDSHKSQPDIARFTSNPNSRSIFLTAVLVSLSRYSSCVLQDNGHGYKG